MQRAEMLTQEDHRRDSVVPWKEHFPCGQGAFGKLFHFPGLRFLTYTTVMIEHLSRARPEGP